MSYYNYRLSQELEAHDYPVEALLMAFMRKADTYNSHHLKQNWSEVWAELQARYNAPGGLLPDEHVTR